MRECIQRRLYSIRGGVDYLIGGSVCTYWSIAQSPDKRETTASGLGWDLFSQYVRALREAKPKYFIYENNKSMSKEIRKAITEAFGFEDICINSALVSAQNRQRLYWVGKRNPDGTYSKVEVEQPKDSGILLRDVLDGATDDRRTGCAEPVAVAQRGRYNDSKTEQHIECRNDNKSNCITTVQKDSMIAEPVLRQSTEFAHGALQVGALPRPNGELSSSQAFRIYEANAKSVTLKAGGGGAGGKTGLYSIPVATTQPDNSGRLWSNTRLYATPVEFENEKPIKAISGADGKTYKVYEVQNGKVLIKGRTYPIKLQDGLYIIRKLTVSECKRLQTVPEWYEFPVSDTQAYRMLGAGWTCDVITHLINATLK